MGGKGQRRREKNYRAAHGGHSRLPPPPDPSSVDALPCKLRKLMAFINPSQPGSEKASVSNEQRNGGSGSGSNKNLHSKDKVDSKSTRIRGEDNDGSSVTTQHMDQDDEIFENSTPEKRKKMKKRKRVSDLRFEALEESGAVGQKRRERKKKRLEAMKKKHKKVKTEENEDFPVREKIKFGEVVEAPPKLVAVPKLFHVMKALKSTQDASQQRLRLKAVEAYRNRKGWASRPGIDLLPPILTPPSV